MQKETINVKEMIFDAFYERKLSNEYRKLMHIYCELGDKLCKTLTEEQKVLFEKFDEAYADLHLQAQEELVDFVFEFFKALFKN